MTKSRSSLANSIRIVFASLFLCLFGALPTFATDGIYTQFGLDLGYAGRIGYPGPEWAIYVYGAGTAATTEPTEGLRPRHKITKNSSRLFRPTR